MRLLPPDHVRKMLPLTQVARISSFRETATSLIAGKDERLALIFGPCSIHDLSSACEYGRRFRDLAEEVSDTFFCVMRVYIEKPRTIAGWKGLVYDPHLDGSSDLQTGIFWARELFLTLTDFGVPIATEILNPLLTPFFSDLITWGFVGARTSASQTHRELASHLPFPIGFKNSTDGNIEQAIHAMAAARLPHTIPMISPEGFLTAIDTAGNPWTHAVLRGSSAGPNYDLATVARTATLQPSRHRILIDCSHDNCGRYAATQQEAFASLLSHFLEGASDILGMMLESNLEPGSQPLSESPSTLQYGVSVTDPCLSWEATAELIRHSFNTINFTHS